MSYVDFEKYAYKIEILLILVAFNGLGFRFDMILALVELLISLSF